MASDPAFCIHAHFYQPPREDPLTGLIPDERGAAPFHDWNERIHAECYQPNAESGNFGKISFNMGPTLMSWMAKYHPSTCEMIKKQERENYYTYGVGNAMAQAYHHTILPLGSRLDKITQVRWGIADFHYHFGHPPAGLWLPETAVDLETLVILANCGIRYTILAPWQVQADNDTAGRPCQIALPGSRSIVVFTFDRDLSTRISFDPGATVNADAFSQDALFPRYHQPGNGEGHPQCLMVASDGELYGHHQAFRDKFLTRLLNSSLHEQHIALTYPGLCLQTKQPLPKVELVENTSWSCLHGVARWMGECGCTYGSTWKAPLRRGLNRLAATLDKNYLDYCSQFMTDPWELRHAYIGVKLGTTDLESLAQGLSTRKLDSKELHCIELLLDAQFERQRMFTSCGWYFDEFDRIEPSNNIAYAAKAVWLARLATGLDLSHEAASNMKGVVSQRTGLRGDDVFLKMIRRFSEV
jgi:hypothetical protein